MIALSILATAMSMVFWFVMMVNLKNDEMIHIKRWFAFTVIAFSIVFVIQVLSICLLFKAFMTIK